MQLFDAAGVSQIAENLAVSIIVLTTFNRTPKLRRGSR